MDLSILSYSNPAFAVEIMGPNSDPFFSPEDSPEFVHLPLTDDDTATEGHSCGMNRCEVCGLTGIILDEDGIIRSCCGQPMQTILHESVSDDSTHFPIFHEEGRKVTVKVSGKAHPMSEEHHIAFIAIQTNLGCMRQDLSPGMEPEAVFTLSEDEHVKAVYAYCNQHGMWKNSGFERA